jgi:hypothetical protein
MEELPMEGHEKNVGIYVEIFQGRMRGKAAWEKRTLTKKAPRKPVFFRRRREVTEKIH